MCDIFVLSEEFDYVIYQHRYQFRYAVQCTQNEEFRRKRRIFAHMYKHNSIL